MVEQTIKEYGLIVIGYGGTDDSLMNVLEHESVSEHGLFWCQREGSPLSERVVNLLRSSENAYLVTIEGAESLFGTLWSEIERVSLPQPDEIMERAERRRDRVQQRKNEYLGEKSKSTSHTEDDKGAKIKSKLWEARKLANEGEYEEAIDILTNIIADDIESAEIYELRGYIYDELEKYKQAVEDYNRAIDLNPEFHRAYHNRGTTRLNLDEYQQAIEDYTQAINLDPESAESYYGRGNTYRKLEEYERAVEDYTQAIDLDPEYAKAYHNRGVTYQDLGEWEQAIDDHDRAINLDPGMVVAYQNKSETQIRADQPQEAKETARECLKYSNESEHTAVGLMLLIVSKTLLGEDISQEKADFRNVCSESFTTAWSCD